MLVAAGVQNVWRCDGASHRCVLLFLTLLNKGRFVQANAGLPIGITKDEVVKACRRRKAKKYWPTSVEVAYQDLLIDIAYSQSPNTDREMSKL